MKIIKAIVVTGRGADRVSLSTDLPSPFPAADSTPLSLNFDVEASKGSNYVQINFPGVPIEIVNRYPLIPPNVISAMVDTAFLQTRNSLTDSES